MVQELGLQKESASQTAGPYVHIGLTPNFAGISGVYPEDLGTGMITGAAAGERITITGRVLDGTGTPLKDGLLEIWQADAAGRYRTPDGQSDPHFTGWGRCPADQEDGTYRFATVKPGAVPFVDGRMQAPHVSFWIVARGINLGLNTRMYFSDEASANAADPVLTRLEHQNRVPTLIGQRDGDVVRFDIHLQGPQETVFFEI